MGLRHRSRHRFARRLPLHDDRPRPDASARDKVADLDLHYVTAAQLAVDRQIKEGSVPQPTLVVEPEADSPNLLGRQCPFGPNGASGVPCLRTLATGSKGERPIVALLRSGWPVRSVLLFERHEALELGGDFALAAFGWSDGNCRPSFRSPFGARRSKSGRSVSLRHFPGSDTRSAFRFWYRLIARRGRLRHPSRRVTFILQEHRSVSNRPFPASSDTMSPALSMRDYCGIGWSAAPVSTRTRCHALSDQPIAAT